MKIALMNRHPRRRRALVILNALFAWLFLAAPVAGRAQSSAGKRGAIEGVVYNITNGLPLGRAKVMAKNIRLETLTDDYGHFLFSGLPDGEYQLEVSYLGFVPQRAAVVVADGKTASRDFQLAREGAGPADDSSIVQLERFTVVADQAMTAQALAMNEQRHAANIKNVMAFEELGEQGQENIGNYVRFLPGVVIMDDGENPGQVALGGFGPEFSNIQLDGGDVAGTGVGITSGRSLSIKDVPMVNVERIEVTKVPTPDMPASGLGGSMNIVTRSLLGIKSPKFSYQMYMNFNNRDGLAFDGGPRQGTAQASPKHLQPSFNLSLTVPLGRRLAFGLGASRTWFRRPTDNTPNESANWNLRAKVPGWEAGDPIKDIALIEALWSQNASISTTENIQANLEVKLAKNDTLALGFQRRNTAEQTSAGYMVARFGTGTGDGSYVQSGTKAGVLELNSRNNNEFSTETNHLTMQYRHLGPRWRVSAKAVYSGAERIRDGMNKGALESVTTTTPTSTHNLRGEGINEGGSILPSTYILTGTDGTPVDGFDPFDANGYALKSVMQGYGVYKTNLLTGRADVEHVFGANFSMKAGGAYQRQEKDDTRLNNNYTFQGDARGKAVSDYGLVDDSIDVKMNGNPVRWISPVKTHELFAAHPEMFTIYDNASQYAAQNSKRMIEDISAAYLRLDLRLLDNRMSITGGLRYEKTKLDGWSVKQDGYAIYQRDENGELLRDANGVLILKPEASTTAGKNKLIYQERAHHEGQDYDGIHPSLNINATLTDNLVLRLAYARTIGRPNVSYIVAGIAIPNPEDLDVDQMRTILVGNPGLKPWTADSFHLTLDSYEMKGGYGSIGVYRKYVSNFFAQRYLPTTGETLQYYNIPETDRQFLLDSSYRLRRWENVGDGNLTGLELSYRQDLFFLPTWLKKTQVWVNYTHLKVGGANAQDFTGFTPDVFSCGINFIRPRYSIRLTCAYQAETKTSLDYSPDSTYVNRYPPETYTYQGSYTKYGVTAEYALAKELILFVNWDNVFAQDRMYYRRAPDTPGWAARSQRNVIPSVIMMGVKGQF